LDFDDEDEGGEEWLVSYADMMTLIACFFILMMAFANYDPVGFNVKAEQLSKHFRKDKYKSSDMKLKEITEEIARHDMKDRAKISMKEGELIVTFSSSMLFANGSAILTEDMKSTLDALIDVIKTSNPNHRVLIEGHADDDLNLSKYETQWELSSIRAARVAERFSYFGFNTSKIVAIGKGDNDKAIAMAPNEKVDVIKEKRKLNRRIVIRLLEPKEKQKVKFGFGIYFKDATEDVKENKINDIDDAGFKVE